MGTALKFRKTEKKKSRLCFYVVHKTDEKLRYRISRHSLEWILM